MSAGETAPDLVAARIVDRYSNPARKAYTYLFRLQPGTSLDSLVPEVSAVRAAWVDEGSGLIPTPAEEAVRRCAGAASIRPHDLPPTRLTPHQRKQMMARVIQFTVTQPEAERCEVHLVSRSLGFSPKGDREAREEWRPAAADFWYSAYRPDDDE